MFTINNHYTNNHHTINNDKNSVLVSLLTFLLTLSFTILALRAPQAQAQAEAASHKTQTLCDKSRTKRQQDINRNPNIEMSAPLHKSGDASCFSPAENLYLMGLIEAEVQLGANAPWYEIVDKSNRDKAKLACKVMGYTGTPLSTTEACITARYNELMHPYNEKYQRETIDYIDRRNDLGKTLVEQCVTAFHRSLPQLPQQIQLPLAYYDRKLHSYPDWYVEARMDDNNWLMDMRSTMASEIVSDALAEQCTGGMIWWLYISN